MSEAPLRVAYLVNQYPKVSHSFIRREILALEAAGVVVDRYSVRGWLDAVADPDDELERGRTRYLLRGGAAALIGAVAASLLASPGRFVRAVAEAVRLSRGAERPLAVHLIYLAEAALLARWLRASGAQHLHAHFGTNSAAVALLALRLGGPGFSFTVHGPEEFDKPAALRLAAKMQAARFVVAISSYGRSQLFRWLPHDQWDKVAVVRCGLDAAFHAVAAQAAPPQTAARLVCVGRLCEQKGQLLLVQALARLQARGVPCELVLAGDGELRAPIEDLARRLGVSQRLRITGWIGSAQVREELLAARAMVLPSFAEGLPVVIMEAMALRRPVISTYVAGIPELVRAGESGWLVPAGDVEALTEAMAQCLSAPPEMLTRLGDQARERVLARHDVRQEAHRLQQRFVEAGQKGCHP
jgi:colanic acid/amylovoran biosynthesis glycosyltransferase